VVLRAARLLDIESGKIITPGEVLVQGERIAEVGSAVKPPAGAQVIDLGDRMLLPGLIDVHVHLFLHPGAEDLQTIQESVPQRTRALVWSWAPQLAHLDDAAYLVHGDFGKRNLLVRSVAGKWIVAAVLDWELAVSGSPLADLGHFLRYERASRPLVEPHFSDGYFHAGGTLPQNWRQLARLVDVTALCESLAHDQLPDTVVAELVELISAVAENGDPRLA
jgi:hypothetical protein